DQFRALLEGSIAGRQKVGLADAHDLKALADRRPCALAHAQNGHTGPRRAARMPAVSHPAVPPPPITLERGSEDMGRPPPVFAQDKIGDLADRGRLLIDPAEIALPVQIGQGIGGQLRQTRFGNGKEARWIMADPAAQIDPHIDRLDQTKRIERRRIGAALLRPFHQSFERIDNGLQPFGRAAIGEEQHIPARAGETRTVEVDHQTVAVGIGGALLHGKGFAPAHQRNIGRIPAIIGQKQIFLRRKTQHRAQFVPARQRRNAEKQRIGIGESWNFRRHHTHHAQPVAKRCAIAVDEAQQAMLCKVQRNEICHN
ncbi:hypothetical protein E4T56_gene7520, partial [Termitomyces sp. T112]